MCVTQYANAKICVTQTQTPNASRWNIGAVGSPKQNSCIAIGHADFMLIVTLSLALGSQHEHNFQWNMVLPKMFLFFLHAMASNISCNNVVKVQMEGTASQIFLIGLSFCFIQFRKKSFKNIINVYQFSK